VRSASECNGAARVVADYKWPVCGRRSNPYLHVWGFTRTTSPGSQTPEIGAAETGLLLAFAKGHLGVIEERLE
jgi:hypothetical protein